jgi:hypothetical protein
LQSNKENVALTLSAPVHKHALTTIAMTRVLYLILLVEKEQSAPQLIIDRFVNALLSGLAIPICSAINVSYK